MVRPAVIGNFGRTGSKVYEGAGGGMHKEKGGKAVFGGSSPMLRNEGRLVLVLVRCGAVRYAGCRRGRDVEGRQLAAHPPELTANDDDVRVHMPRCGCSLRLPPECWSFPLLHNHCVMCTPCITSALQITTGPVIPILEW